MSRWRGYGLGAYSSRCVVLEETEMNRYYDNTRLQSFRECRRKYYFRHLRDLVPVGPLSPALAFGRAWHDGMNVVWDPGNASLSDSDLIFKAWEAWTAAWSEDGYSLELTETEEKDLGPRSPLVAQDMLIQYVMERRAQYINQMEVLAIEQPFAVPMDPNDPTIWLVGRLDKVVRYQGRIHVLEHKTTTSYRRNGPFRDDFINSFSPNSQVDGYTFAANMLYGDCKAVWVDAALVHRVERGFRWIPVEKSLNFLDAWLWEATDTARDMEEQREILEDLRREGTSEPFLRAFRKNTQACTSYGGCQYADLCRYVQNPDEQQVFPGFSTEHWSPFDILHLEKLNMPAEEPTNG